MTTKPRNLDATNGVQAMPYIGVDAVLEIEPAGWAGGPKPSVSKATAAASVALEAQAKKTAAAMIEARAHRYAQVPSSLDAIELGLSRLTPRQLRYRVAVLIGHEISTPRKLRGFGGEVALINLKAALIFAESLIDAELGS